VNRKGQALVESLIIAVILIFSMGFFLRFALKMQSALVVDEFVEQALICLLSQKTSCEEHLRHQLSERGYQEVQIHSQHFQSKYVLRLQMTSPWKDRIKKESELADELSVTL
jgi:hypothetical protein